MTDPQGKPLSCADCPSRLTSVQATRFFGKSIGTPVCATYGKPMGRMTSTDSEIAGIERTLAKNCPSYGHATPPIPQWDKAEFLVMLPDPSSTRPDMGESPRDVKSCLNCSNYVEAESVSDEAGWNAGICAAKGKLILGSRNSIEARYCEFRSLGTSRKDTSGMTFIPEYADNFGKSGTVAPHLATSATFVDPVDYVTDKEVSESDAEHGIRAWRKISDNGTDRHVWLPIYRIDFFSPEEQLKIPRTGDDEHPEDYYDHFQGTYKIAALWTELDETPALWGRAGGGKTEKFRHMAWLMCLPFERISITGSTELDDLAGKWLFEGGETTFEFGRLPRAWQKPCVICIDEPNTGPPDVWQFIRPLTDNSKQLVLDMAKGQRITRHMDAFLGMAMNPAWDPLNTGANLIGDADANRLMHLAIELPDPKLERQIIATRCKHDGWDIPKDTLESVMRIAKDIRDNIEADGLTISWAIRPQIKVARALRWFDFLTAYRMAAADYLEPAQAEQILDIVKTHVEV